MNERQAWLKLRERLVKMHGEESLFICAEIRHMSGFRIISGELERVMMSRMTKEHQKKFGDDPNGPTWWAGDDLDNRLIFIDYLLDNIVL